MLGSQVTNKQTAPDTLFLEPLDSNKRNTHSDTLSVFQQLQSWLCVRMFCKRPLFCASYMPIRIPMSLIIVIMKVHTVTVPSSRKQLRSSIVVVTSDSETSTIQEECSEPENSDDITSDVWCKTD